MTALVSDIIQRVQRLLTLPIDDTLFTDSDYTSFMNDCLIEKIYPRLMKVREDYCLVREVFNLQNSSGQDLYTTGVMPIPSRAWGNTLRELRYIDVSGNYYKMNHYFLEDFDLYQTRNLAFSSSFRKGYINFNSGIKMVPPPLQDPGSIEMHYIVTPSSLISNDEGPGAAYAPVSNMQYDTPTNIATYTCTQFVNGSYLDSFCPINSQRVFDVYNASTGMLVAVNVVLTRQTEVFGGNTTLTGTCVIQTGTNIISPNITEMTNFQGGGFPLVTNTYDANLYLVEAGTNPFTPIPPVLDNLLVYELAIKILSAQGYVEELQIFKAEHDDLRKDLLSQMAMRVECEPYVLSNKRGVRASVLYGAGRSRRTL